MKLFFITIILLARTTLFGSEQVTLKNARLDFVDCSDASHGKYSLPVGTALASIYGEELIRGSLNIFEGLIVVGAKEVLCSGMEQDGYEVDSISITFRYLGAIPTVKKVNYIKP